MKKILNSIAILWGLVAISAPPVSALPDLSIPAFQIQLSTVNSQRTVTFSASIKNNGSNYFDQVTVTPVINHSATVGVAIGTISLTNVAGNRWQGQAIVPSDSFYLSRIDLEVYNKGMTTDNIRLNLRRDSGSFFPSTNISDILTTVEQNVLYVDSMTPTFQEFPLSAPVSLSAGTTYWLTIENDVAQSTNAYGVWADSGVAVNSLAVNSPTPPTSPWSYYPTPSELFRKLYRPADTVIQFYQGDPSNGGTLIGSSTITLPLAADATSTVAVNCPFTDADALDFYAVVDGPGFVNESDETNNSVHSTIQKNSIANVLTGSDGKTKVSFQPGAVPYGFYAVSIDVSPTATSAVQSANSKTNTGTDRFRSPIISTMRKVSLFQSSDLTTPVESPRFSAPVTITIPFDDNGQGFVLNTNPLVPVDALSVYWLNERDGLWVRLPDSIVDANARTVTAAVPHFSYFILMGMNAADLSQAHAYPVPFVPAKGHTRIKFTGLSPQCVIKIYTVAGELVKTIEESDGDGFNDSWDGTGAASGTYLYVIDNAAQVKTGQLVIVK